MPKIIHVKPLSGYRLSLSFDDGTTGKVDLSPLAGKGVFAAWNDVAFFRRVTIGAHGELCWGEQIDLCPDAMYLRMTGKRPDELFPSLKSQSIHA